MTALSEDLQTLLDAERDIDVPSAVQRKRMLERLEPLLLVPVGLAAASVVASAGSSSAGTAATLDAAGGAVLSAAIKVKIATAVVAAALIGGAVGAAGHAYLASPPKSAVIGPPALRTPPAAAPAVAAPPQPAAAPSDAPLPSLSSPARERPHLASSLRAERLLIEAASAALMRGDRQSAILALRQHARQFPKGDLAQEREVLWAKASAASGDDPAGEKPGRPR